ASPTGVALREYEASIVPSAVVPDGGAWEAANEPDAAPAAAARAGAEAAPAALQAAEPCPDYPSGTPLQALLHRRRAAHRAIQIRNAREHNLKNVDVEIPRDTFTVITGVSGSGKSTLAFDILFNEGQRRYLESLNAY